MTLNDREELKKRFRHMDRPGEAEARRTMREMYGENKPLGKNFDPSLAAVCKNGVFVGKKKDGILAFKGIPFAKPPVKELRWMPPEPPEDSDEVREAYYYGHSPIQTEWPSETGSYYPQSENCLTLNVWTADGDTKDKAVMVFFHGGSYGWGATSDPIYDGQTLVAAHRDIVLVTAEYRVGIMGFIDFSEVEGGEKYEKSGNLGLLDHIAALKWVRNNIASFGGNPENVTIFGESAGGGTVSLLPIIKEAKGLFKRSIAESGSVALTFSREECKPLAQKLLKESGAKNMSELLAIPEEKLMKLNENLNDFNNFPERDGILIPEDPYEPYRNGTASDVDMIMGTNSDEVRYWMREMRYYVRPWLGTPLFKLGTPVMFDNNMAKVSEEDKKNYLSKYMKLFNGRKLWKMVEFYNDVLFRTPAIAQAEGHSDNGGRTFMYYWSYPSAHKNLGACHAVELAYVFGNTDVKIYTGDNVDISLSEEVQNMWVNFAKTGNPSTQNTKWERFERRARKTMILGSKIKSEQDPLSQRRRYTFPFLKYMFNGCYANLKINIPVIYFIFGAVLGILSLAPALIAFVIDFFVRLFKFIKIIREDEK